VTRRFDAVIFDMDGVLLDSEPLHYRVLNQVLRDSDGYTLTESENDEFLGTTTEAMFATLIARHSLGHSMSYYVESYERSLLRVLEQPLTPQPGVVTLISACVSANVALAVASSSKRTWVVTTLRSLGLADLFPVVVTGDDVVHGKPDPEIYRLTAARLGIRPERCIAIEDAPNGVTSAHRAGMTVLGVRTPYTAHLSLDGALRSVDSLEDVDLEALLNTSPA
jgi:HAD superfamily hydrolase (TIGR01509 family)